MAADGPEGPELVYAPRSVGTAVAYLRGLRPELPARVWVVVAGGAISSLGNGFVMPYGSIYLHVVRGLAIPVVGAILSLSALAALLVSVAGGSLIDRISPKALIVAGLCLQTAGFAYLGFVTNVLQAATAMIVIGLGAGCFFPAVSALLAAITTRAERASAAALQYAANNLGIGLGAILGGVIVATSRPSTFTTLYLIDAATFVAFALMAVLLVPSGRHRATSHERTGYRVVVRDLRFMAVVAFNGVVVMSAYAQVDSAVPLYARVFLAVPTTAIGLILAANTGFIVLAQLPIARAVRRLRRTQTMALSGAVWAAAWLIGEVASLERGLAAAVWLGLFAVVFGAGECLLSSVIGPLVADLAPPAARGRYMATFNLSWSVGLFIGPSVGGLLVGSFLRSSMWMIWAFVSGGLVLWARLLGRHLPEAVNVPPPAS
ncbi:MAG: MFS transporter [Candidatus Dormiibacterota bacterium]